MGTVKKRINLSVDENLYRDLESFKKLKGDSSLSSTTLSLVKEALERQEDFYFRKISEKREKETSISHNKFWK